RRKRKRKRQVRPLCVRDHPAGVTLRSSTIASPRNCKIIVDAARQCDRVIRSRAATHGANRAAIAQGAAESLTPTLTLTLTCLLRRSLGLGRIARQTTKVTPEPTRHRPTRIVRPGYDRPA